MLRRIENAYLGILRVVVLVVATIALIVTTLAFVAAIPPLASQTERFAVAPHGGTLRDYIDAKRATAPAAAPGRSGAATAPVRSANADVKAAAAVVFGYLPKTGNPPVATWERGIEDSAQGIATTLHDTYFKDVRALAEQLGRSRGRKLTGAQVAELLDFNRARFVADADAKAAERAVAGVTAMSRLYLAGIAFVLFIMVVFTFLFVKVERSLRLVRTVRTEQADA